jgi:glycerol uptake facilitator-like aquaporin
VNQFVSRVFAEYLGTGLIVATVLGAGHMVQSLGADPALGLIIIAICVGSVLFGAIAIFGPVSGAHFNPLVTLSMLIMRPQPRLESLGFVLAQLLGALSGAVVANLMFEKAALSLSSIQRIGAGVFLGEVLATFGLILIILLLVQQQKILLVAPAVALWIVAGHVFTSSTSFANPAVSFGRMLSQAPSSISPDSVPMYLIAQFLGTGLAVLSFMVLTGKRKQNG